MRIQANYNFIDKKLMRGAPVASPIKLLRMKKDGVNQIIDLRQSNPINKFVEKAFCKLLGIKYSNQPSSFRSGSGMTRDYFEKVNLLRKYIPDIAITTDIMVGFPTETEEDFLDTIRTDETINKAMEFFLPADKQPNTTATPPSSTTETETETEEEEEVKATPPNHSYTEEEQKSIAKVLRQEINEYIIEKLKECIELCESQTDYALLEIALYENNYIKQRNGHQAFIKAMIALHLLEDGSVKTENLRQKFTSLRKSYATSGMYKEWDINSPDRIKCEKFAEILNA